MNKKVTVLTLKKMKSQGEKITMLTAYDYPTAELVDEAGADTILVGDSLGMVVLGYPDTRAVTLADMIHHGRAVVRGVKRAMVIIDLPFMTYEINREQAMVNAGQVIRETGAQAIKLEGGREVSGAVQGITGAGIPVVGHLGLTPQSVAQLGGFKVQGKDLDSARRLMEDAVILQEAGACAVVLECIPWSLAGMITEKLDIPTIGIGAGAHCDGQVLVFHDVMGLYSGYRPKFVREYAQARQLMLDGAKDYLEEVRRGEFPAAEHSFDMPKEIVDQLI